MASKIVPALTTEHGQLRSTEEVIFDTLTEANRLVASDSPIAALALVTTVSDTLNLYGVGRGEIEDSFREAREHISSVDIEIEGILHEQ